VTFVSVERGLDRWAMGVAKSNLNATNSLILLGNCNATLWNRTISPRQILSKILY
jgi:hypothetical protein